MDELKKFDYNDIAGYVGWKNSDSSYYDYDEIVQVTEKAALLNIDGCEYWVPVSQIISATKSTVEITVWWCQDNGWV